MAATDSDAELILKIVDYTRNMDTNQIAQTHSLSDPGTYIVVFGFLSLIGLIVKMILDRIKKNEEDINGVEKRVLKATVPQTDCDGKQELWAERFDNMMNKFDTYVEQNEKEHNAVIELMEKNSKAQIAQIADFALTIENLSDCVKNLELGKEC